PSLLFYATDHGSAKAPLFYRPLECWDWSQLSDFWIRAGAAWWRPGENPKRRPVAALRRSLECWDWSQLSDFWIGAECGPGAERLPRSGYIPKPGVAEGAP